MSQTKINPAIYEVVRKPIVTEKSTLGSEQNKITFRVANDATKDQVKEAVEVIFNVKVVKVNVINVKGKTKRFRGREGKRSDYKKAIVSIAAGQTIDMTAGV